MMGKDPIVSVLFMGKRLGSVTHCPGCSRGTIHFGNASTLTATPRQMGG